MTRSPDIQERFRKHLEAQQEMTSWANEAKRLHDAGDLAAARRALGKAEQWRKKMEQLSASSKTEP